MMINQIKTALLLALMTAMFLLFGFLLGGRSGMFLALVCAGAINFFSFWYSHTIVLKMYRAQPLLSSQAPDLFRIVEKLARRADIPVPQIYVIPESAPNAFATGRNPDHAVVAVTQGLIHLMDTEELEGVLAHELGHIKNRDILISTLVATMAGAIMWIASMARFGAFFGQVGDDDEGGLGFMGVILLSILAPVAAMVVQMAVSRSREYLADATAARVTGNPRGLASALAKLGTYSRRQPMDGSPATAHMFIVNPLSGRQMASLFSTHPAIEDRVARLMGQDPGSFDHAMDPVPKSMEDQSRSFWNHLS